MQKLLSALFLASLLAVTVPVGAIQNTPSPVVSRAEAIKVLVEGTPVLRQRLEDFRLNMPPIALFDDVPQDNFLAPYLEAAFERGLITGNADRRFYPTQPITQEQLVTLHARMLAIVDPQVASGFQAMDTGATWYERPLLILQAHGIDTPKPFELGKPARRASVAHMTHQVLAYVTSRAPVYAQTSSPVPVTQNSDMVASVTSPSSGVPQFLPIRQIQPLPTTSVQSTVNAPQNGNIAYAYDSVGTTAQMNTQTNGAQINAGTSNGGYVSSGNQGSTVISAGSYQDTPITTGSSFTDVLSNNNGVSINAGGSGASDDGMGNSFTITIPSLGIGPITVSNPDDPFTHNGLLAPLKNGLGHLFSTPGGGGKILVYGHSSSYPWDVSEYTKIFRRINELNPGDEIFVEYNGQKYKYEVSYEETVPAKDLTAYQDDGTGEDLILYTCWPPDSISQRYLVHAKPV